jgi:hypothetical protein
MELANILLHKISGQNFTLTSDATTGRIVNHNTNQYDGCIGSLQRNQSDVLLGPGDHPIVAPDLMQGSVNGYERMGIFSIYNQPNPHDASNTQILDMFQTFSPDLWLTIIMAYITIFSLLWLSMRRKPRRKTVRLISKLLTACILKQHSSRGFTVIRTTNRILYLLATIFSFYFTYYLTSMIKTDMVVVYPPATIESYQDILDSGVRPAWLFEYGSSSEFEHEPSDTVKEKIWKTAVSMGINKSSVKLSAESVASHGQEIASRREVLIMIRFFGTKLLSHACAFSRSKDLMTDHFPLFRHDESAVENLRGGVFNRLLSGDIIKGINQKITSVFEADLIEASLRFVDLSDLYSDSEKHFSVIHECSQNVVIIPHPDVRMSPCAVLFYTHFVLCFNATCIIILASC